MSLRRLRYQLRCAASGHDTRPRLVGGSMVEHRCLRCGALVGDPQPAASSARRPSAPAAATPAAAPAAPAAVALNGHTDEGEGGLAALQALERLGELHAAGVLTDAEFEVKKAELLRRV